jgi:hypothetical protein
VLGVNWPVGRAETRDALVLGGDVPSTVPGRSGRCAAAGRRQGARARQADGVETSSAGDDELFRTSTRSSIDARRNPGRREQRATTDDRIEVRLPCPWPRLGRTRHPKAAHRSLREASDTRRLSTKCQRRRPRRIGQVQEHRRPAA